MAKQGLFKRIFNRDPESIGSIENPRVPLTPAVVWHDGKMRTPISSTSAMQASAVSACVRVLAEAVASISWFVYTRKPEGGKDRAADHPNYNLLHTRPNPFMSSFAWRELIMKDLLLSGNHYSEIQFSPSTGYIEALWPLVANHTDLVLSPKPHFVVQTNEGPRELAYERVFHVPGLGDGYKGESVIKYGSRSVGLALTQEDFTEEFFDNGSILSGVLESKKGLSKEARARLQEGWRAAHTGSGNRHNVAILEDEVAWKSTGVNPRDAQIIELRKFSIEEIARLFRVPLQMIGHLDRMTNNNIEQLSIDFVVYTLRPWLVRIEQAANYQLFDPKERETYFTEFLIDSLLRGDALARNQALHLQLQDGVINADEWREIENRNPIPDGKGKEYFRNANLMSGDMIAGRQKGANT